MAILGRVIFGKQATTALVEMEFQLGDALTVVLSVQGCGHYPPALEEGA